MHAAAGPSKTDGQRCGSGVLVKALRWITLVGLAATLLMLFASTLFSVGADGLSMVVRLEGGRLYFEYDPRHAGPVSAHGRVVWPPDLDLMLDYHVYPTWWFVRLPLWIPALGWLGLGARPWYLHFAVPAGHCRRCRYDLRGQEAGAGGSVRCPECGEEGMVAEPGLERAR